MNATVQPLFRPESLQARQFAWLGRPAIRLGLPIRFVTVSAVLLAAVATGVLIFGNYARRVDLHGAIIPQSGLVKISAPSAGWVRAISVADGHEVNEGDVLYDVNVDTTTTNGFTQQVILRSLESDRAGIEQEIVRKERIRDAEDDALKSKIENLKAQIAQTSVQVTTQADFERRLRAELDQVSAQASRGLSTRNDKDARQQAWMSAKQRLEELRSTEIRLKAELIDADYKLATNDLQTGNDIDNLKSKISQIEQEIAKSEAHHSVQIRAPASGTVTAIIGHPGQLVTAGAPMLTIVPQHAQMQAQLLAPSSAIGFIRTGERVLLRYSAFPYQKFGQYWGTVVDVSHAALPQEEFKSLLENTSHQTTGMFYRVTVEPDEQFVNVYGNHEQIPASMTVDAFVLLDKRPLYQWILEPLYGLRRDFQK